MNILTINLVLSTLVFWIAARIYVLPRLDELGPRTILLPILLLHAFRHLGLMFLAPGAIYSGIPAAFAYPAAFGDLVAAVLALAAIPAVASNARSARFLVWLFNIEGTSGPAERDRSRDGVRRSSVHGAGLLDPGVLGSGSTGDALHHLRHPVEALAGIGLTSGGATGCSCPHRVAASEGEPVQAKHVELGRGEQMIAPQSTRRGLPRPGRRLDRSSPCRRPTHGMAHPRSQP